MSEYLAPGVFYERVDAAAPAVVAIRTDVAGFVGIAARGPVDRAVPVESWRQFQTTFGSFIGGAFLAYTVRAFFENGGRRCWIVRVASAWAAAAGLEVRDDHGVPAWRLEASSPGVWGDALDVSVREVRRAQTVSDPARSAPEALGVASVSGFVPDSFVRLSQDGSPSAYRVVRAADAVAGQLVFWDADARRRRTYDAPVTGLDLGRPVLVESVAYQVLVRENARLVRVYDDLSPVPDHPRYGPALLPVRERAPDAGARSADSTAPARPPEVLAIRELRHLRDDAVVRRALALDAGVVLPLTGGADGLARLAVEDFVGEPFSPRDSDAERALKRRGLRALEDVAEVALLAVPDILVQPEDPPRFAPPPPCPVDPCRPAPPAAAQPRPSVAGDVPPRFDDADVYRVQQAMIEQCERRRDRVALLDPPLGAARADALGMGAAIAWRTRFDSKFAALSYPWLRVSDPLGGDGDGLREIPAAGHLAGVCAATDFGVGVHKAPANVALGWVQDTTVAVDEAGRGTLNPLGINAIAAVTGRGIRILGARTTSSDPDWIHLNVRRLMIMIEKAIGQSIAWAAFEPNDFVTRSKLSLVTTTFLFSLWQRGALAGASPEEAFFVRCDDDNNPASLRDRGELHLDIGVAPSRPFEFVVVRIGRVDNEFSTTEVAGGVNGRGGN